jgi:5-methylcytosine-specific restriction endonuclease McrA
MAISRKIRFEIFKRDSFKCQYCGRSAPEIVLNVDHINPVSKILQDYYDLICKLK